MSSLISRRAVLSGLLSVTAGGAMSQPLSSLRPLARTTVVSSASSAPEVSVIPRVAPRVRASLNDIIAAANLQGTAGVVLADAETGEVLEQAESQIAVPPASVTKSVTAHKAQ